MVFCSVGSMNTHIGDETTKLHDELGMLFPISFKVNKLRCVFENVLILLCFSFILCSI